MPITIRPGTPDDFPAIAELDGINFGERYSAEDLEYALRIVDPSAFLLAVDGAKLVGSTVDLPFGMALPGGTEVRAAGITWVSTDVTYRRQGILTQLISQQLRARAEDGYPAAILTASEGGIYGRYGFGAATRRLTTTVERRSARLVDPADASSVRRLTTDQARDLLPPLYERWRSATPGGLTRGEGFWAYAWREHGQAGSALSHLVHPDGYVSYRITSDMNEGLPRFRCRITDYVAITPEAHAALWRVLLDMDLVGPIVSMQIPEDDPLPLLLTNAREVRVTPLGDALWLRPLDVAALLSARTYAVEVDTVLEVVDPLLGDGRYRLTGGPDGASCTRTDDAPEVTLGVAALGSVVLGGTRLPWLARGGRVTGGDSVISRLDRALLADRAPWHGTDF